MPTSSKMLKQACLILSPITLMHLADIAIFTIEGLWSPCAKQVCWCHFSCSIDSLHFTVSSFGHSHNISNLLPAKRGSFTEGLDDG